MSLLDGSLLAGVVFPAERRLDRLSCEAGRRLVLFWLLWHGVGFGALALLLSALRSAA